MTRYRMGLLRLAALAFLIMLAQLGAPSGAFAAGCLAATGEVSCGTYPGQYWVKLGGAGAFAAGEIAITSETPGVTVLTPMVLTGSGGATYVLISGAAPGDSVTLRLDSSADRGGEVAGAAICCSGDLIVSIPDDIVCDEPWSLAAALSCDACSADGSSFVCLCQASLATSGTPKTGALSLSTTIQAKNGLLVAASGPDWECGAVPVGPGKPLVCKLKTAKFASQRYKSVIDLALKFDQADDPGQARSCLSGRAGDESGRVTAASSATCVALDFPKAQPLVTVTCDKASTIASGNSCQCRFDNMVRLGTNACGCEEGFRLDGSRGCVAEVVHKRALSDAHKTIRSNQHDARTTRQRPPAHRRIKSLLDEAHKEFTSAEHDRKFTKQVPQHKKQKSVLDEFHREFKSDQHDRKTTKRIETHKRFQSQLDEFHQEFKSDQHDRKTTKRVETHKRFQSLLDEFHEEFKSDQHDRKTTKRIETHKRFQSQLDEFHQEFKSDQHDRKTTKRVETHKRFQSQLDEFHQEFKSDQHDRKTTRRRETHKRLQSQLDEFHQEFKSDQHDRKTTRRRETHKRFQSQLDEFHQEFKSDQHDRKTTGQRETHQKRRSQLDGIHKIMTSEQHDRATSLPRSVHSRKRSNADEHSKDRSDGSDDDGHSRKRSIADQHSKDRSEAAKHSRRRSNADQQSGGDGGEAHNEEKSAAQKHRRARSLLQQLQQPPQ